MIGVLRSDEFVHHYFAIPVEDGDPRVRLKTGGCRIPAGEVMHISQSIDEYLSDLLKSSLSRYP